MRRKEPVSLRLGDPMPETRPGLVLHLAGVGQSLHIALAPAEADALRDALADLMANGQTKSLTTADGGRFAVNFAHVATAHVETTRSDATSGHRFSPQFQWKSRNIGVSDPDTPTAVDNSPNFNGNRTSDFH
ncbi:hypothetical protein [Saccharopolyspora sp. ASAGF58]|uniref:hypothetical protein n=1 Tax=Saccharopolyspora sp. ASAGF58 TaxID=2719023 RepID=UPI001B309D3F|nr:hypothetical protein [Saccharopolyspora sp. ASAGF58]